MDNRERASALTRMERNDGLRNLADLRYLIAHNRWKNSPRKNGQAVRGNGGIASKMIREEMAWTDESPRLEAPNPPPVFKK